MVPLMPMEGLASRLMSVERSSKELKPPEREMSASSWFNQAQPPPQILSNQAPSINDLCHLFEQSEEFLIAINDSKLADIVDNEMKQTNWLETKPPVIQGFNPSASSRGPVFQNVTPIQSDPRTNLIQAPKSSNPAGFQQTMGGSWRGSQGAPKSSVVRRCAGPTTGFTDPFGPQQGIRASVSRMAGPIHRMNPSVLRGHMDPKLIPGVQNRDVLRARLPAGLQPNLGFDPRSSSSPLLDVKQQLRTLETQIRPKMNQESPTEAFDLNFGSPSGLQMRLEERKEDQMDIDFILHQPSPTTGPTFTIEILGDQGISACCILLFLSI